MFRFRILKNFSSEQLIRCDSLFLQQYHGMLRNCLHLKNSNVEPFQGSITYPILTSGFTGGYSYSRHSDFIRTKTLKVFNFNIRQMTEQPTED